jgi:hypothetical protein
MRERRTISTARKQLFELFDRVTGNEGERVIIARRTSSKEAVLIAKDYLDHLETASRRFAGQAAETFSLFGSATLTTSPDEVLRATRREQARLRAHGEQQLQGARQRRT